MGSQITCPNCGKRFTPWRGKKFCSEACRKRAENRRLRGDETPLKAMMPDAQKSENFPQQNQQASETVRGDESPAASVRAATWVACN
jgi:hypothetical protein